MNWFCISHCIWIVLIFFTLIRDSSSCWDSKSPGYGETTPDYDLPVGSHLVVNCTLKAETLPEIKIRVNSSFLVFKRDGDNQVFSAHTHQIDALTAQLRLPNSKVTDSGMYHCQIVLPDTSKHVCSTNVYVGYPPKAVTNFNCISRNFDNLTCTWDIEPNKVRTDYSVQKIFLFQDTLQNCPKPNNNTFCQWRDDTEPPYQTMNKNLTFVVHGNNSLGFVENEFKFDHFAIVIPNSPEDLNAVDIGEQSITVRWQPPKMTRILDKPALHYQLWLEELGPDAKDVVVVETGEKRLGYTFDRLIPNFFYNISVRCRSNYTSKDDMWSPVESLILKTHADVPYLVPEIHPEAFLMHNFGNYRNTTLYWKPVPKRFHNGEGFHYHIVYTQSNSSNDIRPDFVNSKTPFAQIGHLHNDSAYIFRIHSANKEGISVDYRTIFIDERNRIISSPKDIRAISHELGYYNLSWSVSGYSDEVSYIVFWCAGRKPSHCEGPIQWSDGILKERHFSLDVADVNSNFQFAVAATFKNRSSGMQWASCIVPRKAPLGQIPITHIEPTSSTLRVIWKLDCEAQKSVIDRYVLTYCREGRGCEDAVAKSDVQSYTLNDLHPFSNYSVKLRAFNKENKPSEDVDEMYQSTLSGGPSDPPRNIKIFSKTSSSFSVRWTPPLEPNGVITDYFIYHNELKHRMKDATCRVCDYHVQELKEFTSYDVSIEACVGVYCSPKSPPVMVLTDVGVPGRMDPPRVETVNETHLKVSWTAPFIRNGPIDFFDIQWEVGNETTNQTVIRNLSTFVELSCSNLLDGGVTYMFSVRAANEKNGTALYGPFSDPTKATACIMSQGVAMIIGVAIGGTLALAIFLLIVYKLVKWMSDKIHQVKNIAVRLPKELEGPESNPLSNYESFKNGLVQSIHTGKVNHLSYAVDEGDNKNRHGSGSSQFSNSSTDELIFKNGKCTKFGRKPSGDSSGCSSMSSNTTTRMQLSSDSGTESDFVTFPDSIITEQNGKPHMPILMEMQDSSGVDTQPEKYNNFINGMVLKVDQPYSKFGISGNATSNVINPLAFYSCNLANSEPSVFEAQLTNKQPTMSPYSKMGLAKSSGDILGRNKETGYSKFGFVTPQDCFSIDIEKLTPLVGIALVENAALKNDLKRDNWKVPLKENTALPADIILSAKLCDYKTASNKPSPGYVQVGDMRSTKELDLSSSTSSLDEDNSPLQISGDLQGDLSSVWTTGVLLPTAEEIGGLYFVDPFNKPLNHHQQTDSLNLNTSSSPSAGCLCVVPSDDVCTTGRDLLSSPGMNDSQFKFSHNISPDSDDTVYHLRKGQVSIQPPEATPETSTNGYVPLSTLSSSVCCASIVPNATESNPSILPGDFDQNYITPSNKSEFKLLQDPLCNGTHSRSEPLKYRLKPLPKMESEICEV